MYKKDSTKTSSSHRTMPMPQMIKNIFKKIWQSQVQCKLLQPNDYIDEGYVFAHPDGRIITPNFVTRRFKRILANNYLPEIRFHNLRHSAASYLLFLGFGMQEIQAWLGHENIATTNHIINSIFLYKTELMVNSY